MAPAESAASEPAPPRSPLACGALGRYDPLVVESIASRLGVPMSTVHRDAGSMLMLDREPIRWRSVRSRAFAWSEGPPAPAPSVRSWEQAATSLSACGLVIRGGRRFVHSSAAGIAPVYYLDRGEATYYASRIDALVLGAGLRLSVDWMAWASIFTISAPVGERTPFEEVRRLRPFSVLECRDGRPVATRHRWPWAEIEPDLSLEEGAPALLHSVRESVARLAPGPTVCLLSGGLDSRLMLSVHAERSEGQTRALTFASTPRDVELAPQVAAAVGVPHELLTLDDPEVYWRSFTERALLSDYQFPVAVAWAALRPRIRELRLPVLDGLGFDSLAMRGDRMLRADMLDPDGTAGTARLLWSSIRRRQLMQGPQRAFDEPLAAALTRLSRRQFVAESRPYRGHPNEAILLFYLARTWRAISLTPHQVLGSDALVLTPLASDAVARATLRINPSDKPGRHVYRALFELLDSPVAHLPSTTDPRPRGHRPRTGPRYSETVTRELERLLRDSPLGPSLAPTLRRTLAQGELAAAIRRRMAYRSAITLAWFGLWCERYGSLLRDLDVTDALAASAGDEPAEDRRRSRRRSSRRLLR